jgi:hypothetical protein
VSLWFEGEDKKKIFSSQVLNTNIFDLHLHKPKQATMQTQLNQYTKGEIAFLSSLAFNAGYEDLANKLEADYHWLADMEKEKSE